MTNTIHSKLVLLKNVMRKTYRMHLETDEGSVDYQPGAVMDLQYVFLPHDRDYGVL
jgi:hypothetical protein